MSNDLADAAQRLADVLIRENDALRHMDFSAAVALVIGQIPVIARKAAADSS